MPEKTPLRSIQNALAFELKRPCVFLKAGYVPENPFISVRTIPFSLHAHTYAPAPAPARII